MAQQTIGIGTTPNDGTGDTLRVAFDKTNQNFTEVYGDISTINTAISNINVTLPTQNTANVTLTDADFAGNVIRRFSSASDLTITVNTGITGTEPFTAIRKGLGAVTFVAGAGVTINSVAGNLALRAQYSSGTLIREGVDTYILIGDLG